MNSDYDYRIVDRAGFPAAFTAEDRERYWRLVRATLKNVFKVSAASEVTEKYKASIERQKAGVQIAAYHASPLSTAADLAGRANTEISEAELKRYLSLQAKYLDRTEASTLAEIGSAA